MNNLKRIFITVVLFTLSLPALAANASSAVDLITKFINEYEDIIKHLITLLVAVITIWGAVKVARITREAPDAAVKLEQLKFIDVLILEKAWSKPELYFVVEEAFRQYFKTHIPIEIIKLLANVEERFYAFSYYEKVGGLISYDKQTKKIKSLSNLGKNLRVVSLLSLSVMSIHIFVLFFAIAFHLFSQFNPLNLILSGIVFVFSGLFGCLGLTALDRMSDLKSNFKRFESKIEGKFEATEVNKTDWGLFLICVLVTFAIWIAGIYWE